MRFQVLEITETVDLHILSSPPNNSLPHTKTLVGVNELLGAKGPLLVGEEVRKEDVGKVVDKFQPSYPVTK
jgi:hypothetical protein